MAEERAENYSTAFLSAGQSWVSFLTQKSERLSRGSRLGDMQRLKTGSVVSDFVGRGLEQDLAKWFVWSLGVWAKAAQWGDGLV